MSLNITAWSLHLVLLISCLARHILPTPSLETWRHSSLSFSDTSCISHTGFQRDSSLLAVWSLQHLVRLKRFGKGQVLITTHQGLWEASEKLPSWWWGWMSAGKALDTKCCFLSFGSVMGMCCASLGLFHAVPIPLRIPFHSCTY